jgi:hypothetical protein
MLFVICAMTMIIVGVDIGAHDISPRLVKVLNKYGVVHIKTNTNKKPIVGSTNHFTPSSI